MSRPDCFVEFFYIPMLADFLNWFGKLIGIIRKNWRERRNPPAARVVRRLVNQQQSTCWSIKIFRMWSIRPAGLFQWGFLKERVIPSMLLQACRHQVLILSWNMDRHPMSLLTLPIPVHQLQWCALAIYSIWRFPIPLYPEANITLLLTMRYHLHLPIRWARFLATAPICLPPLLKQHRFRHAPLLHLQRTAQEILTLLGCLILTRRSCFQAKRKRHGNVPSQ